MGRSWTRRSSGVGMGSVATVRADSGQVVYCEVATRGACGASASRADVSDGVKATMRSSDVEGLA